MTKARAIEILNIGYDGCVKFRETLRDNPDEFDYLNDLLIALLTAIDTLEQDNGWISVKDRMPDKDGRYLVCGDIHLWDIEKYRTNECVVIARFTERNEWLTSLSVKYWMFLPKLPSEDDAE